MANSSTRLAPRLSRLGRGRTPEAQTFPPPPAPPTMSERLVKALSMPVAQPQSPITVPFGPWMPDLPDFANPGATEAKNVIPARNSYRPLPNLSAATDALTARARGAAAAQDASNNTYMYAGDATKLYEVRTSGIIDKSGATYTNATESNWEFALFDGTILATNLNDNVQGLAVGGGGNFADQFTSTLKPKAKSMAVVRDFVVLGNTNDGTDGVKTSRVWWSGIGDATDFDPDSITQCDFQDIRDGGAVERVVGGVEYGLIFQRRQIVRITYVGSPIVFDFSAIDRKRGTPIPGSVVSHGRQVYYISEEGFFVTDGVGSRPIGANQVDRWFWDQFDLGDAHLVSGAVDQINKLVVWAFPGAGNSGSPNRLIIYDWQNRKWSNGEIDTEIMVNAQTEGQTLEGLDAINSDLDALTPTLDSPVWQGGRTQFAAFDPAHKLAYFNGANLKATIETGEVELSIGRHTLATKLRPLIDGGTITADVAGRNRLIDTVSWDGPASIDSAGEMSIRNESRYHRFRCEVAAGGSWQHAQGVQVHGNPQGVR